MSTFISDRETRKTDHVSEQAITVNTLMDQVKSARFFKILLLTKKELRFKKKNRSVSKGQLISKTIYGVLDSPKKRTKKI